jgi:hypothetical protein
MIDKGFHKDVVKVILPLFDYGNREKGYPKRSGVPETNGA